MPRFTWAPDAEPSSSVAGLQVCDPSPPVRCPWAAFPRSQSPVGGGGRAGSPIRRPGGSPLRPSPTSSPVSSPQMGPGRLCRVQPRTTLGKQPAPMPAQASVSHGCKADRAAFTEAARRSPARSHSQAEPRERLTSSPVASSTSSSTLQAATVLTSKPIAFPTVLAEPASGALLVDVGSTAAVSLEGQLLAALKACTKELNADRVDSSEKARLHRDLAQAEQQVGQLSEEVSQLREVVAVERMRREAAELALERLRMRSEDRPCTSSSFRQGPLVIPPAASPCSSDRSLAVAGAGSPGRLRRSRGLGSPLSPCCTPSRPLRRLSSPTPVGSMASLCPSPAESLSLAESLVQEMFCGGDDRVDGSAASTSGRGGSSSRSSTSCQTDLAFRLSGWISGMSSTPRWPSRRRPSGEPLSGLQQSVGLQTDPEGEVHTCAGRTMLLPPGGHQASTPLPLNGLMPDFPGLDPPAVKVRSRSSSWSIAGVIASAAVSALKDEKDGPMQEQSRNLDSQSKLDRSDSATTSQPCLSDSPRDDEARKGGIEYLLASTAASTPVLLESERAGIGDDGGGLEGLAEAVAAAMGSPGLWSASVRKRDSAIEADRRVAKTSSRCDNQKPP